VNAKLVKPSAGYEESFLKACEEFGDENTLGYERDIAVRDFDRYLVVVDAWTRGEQLPAGWIPCTTLWLVDADDYVGSVNIRHELTDWLERLGGHIGYAIRPMRRRQGYGTLICRLALDASRELGLDRVLITCDEDNTGSRKIIERNGGVYENSLPQAERDVPKRRYWFDL
jgi:predicted acetyltransferase